MYACTPTSCACSVPSAAAAVIDAATVAVSAAPDAGMRVLLQAVLGARESLEGCFEVLQPQLADIDCSWQDFLWAVQVQPALQP